jgi:hypothetical protein
MKKRRFSILPLAAVAVAAALVVTVTLALFVATPPTATNAIALGVVGVRVVEAGWTTVSPQPQPTFTKDGDEYNTISKAPQAENTGTVPVWVRVTVAGLENYETTFTKDSTTSAFNSDDWETADWDGTNQKWNPSSGGVVFYYKAPLAAGDTTSAIFDSVKLKNDSGGLDIIVYAEAVQVDWVATASGYAGSAQEAFAALDAAAA